MNGRRIWALASVVAVVVLVIGVLILPVSGATSWRQEGCFPIHEVQPDETLDAIAVLYGVSLPDLLAANELADATEVYAGQQLCIPTVAGEAAEAPADEAPVVEATEVTTETLTAEAAAPTVEALGAERQLAVPTRICVKGQVIDKKHRGMAGVTVIAQTGDSPGMSVKTDTKGRFSFTDLAAGAWVFRVQVPDSWVSVTSSEIKVELDYRHSGCYEIRFKLDPRGCLVAEKTDENGKPLSGWLITASGPSDSEATTSASGVATLNDLIPGTYLVSEEAGGLNPAPWIWKPISPSQVSVEVKAAWRQGDCAEVAFKNMRQPTSCIRGFKVDDAHSPIGGWKVYTQPADEEEPVFATTTADDGSFFFPSLPLGTWTVWEEVPPYWTSITPSRFTVTLDKSTTDCPVVRFKNRPPDLCAEGYKVDEEGEGLAGWTVEAFASTNPAEVLSAVTDDHGYYRLNGLTLGEWVFREVRQPGWKPITPEAAKVEMVGTDGCVQVPIFRNQSPLGCIEGFKQDNLGYGLAGWNITLVPQSGSPSQHALTDGIGHYQFDKLPMGKYEVYEELQAGWTPTTPTKYVVELRPGDTSACARVQAFVNKQVPRDICIDGYKLDAVGEVGLPDWPVEAKNLDTGVVSKATTDGVGYFRFSNLQPGEYEVTVGDKEGWVHVGAASQIVAVSWPPKDACESVTFYNRQAKTRPTDSPDEPNEPGRPDGPDRPHRPGKDGCRATYIVCYGDTLNKIASWESTSVRAILRANHIPNADRIYPGQELCIP